MSAAELLLKEIQELQGKPLGERYKIINNITHLVQCWDHNTLKAAEILNAFTPKDNLEKKLWVKLLSNFKHVDIFLQTLKGEDNKLIEILLQNSEWFFTTNKFGCDELLHEIIPNMPYARRKNLLQCLSKYRNESELEEYFKTLRIQYGLHFALMLLPSCNSKFIEQIMKEEKIQISEKLLQKIYLTHSDVVINYFKYLLEHEEICNQINTYGAVLEKLALTKPEVFFELYHKCDTIRLKRLGANTTQILISRGKNFILESPAKYVNILHERQLHARLNYTEYQKFYMALLPETEKKFAVDFNSHGRTHKLLQNVKKNKFEFISGAYKLVYGTDLLDNKTLITESLMGMLSTELRIKCAQYMLENKDKNPKDWEKWYCYVTPAEAIPKLRELIYMTTDSNERLKYVEYMIKCSGINKDQVELTKVLKYISERHRNEDIKFRVRELKTVENHFNIKEFKSEIWNYLDETFKLINLGAEWSMARDNSIKNLLIQRIQYCLDNDKEQNIREHIEFYVKMQNHCYNCDFNILKDNFDFEKLCINCIGACIPELEEEYKSSMDALNFQRTISDFNKRHPDDKMTTLKFEWIINYINKIVKEKSTYEISNFKEQVEHDPETKEFLHSVLPPSETNISIHNLHKYIKQPEIIFEQFDEIKKEALQNYNLNTFLKLVRWRKFIYIPGLRDKIFESCLHEFQNSKDSTTKACALAVLSYLMNSETFYELVKSFFPENKKITVGQHKVADYKIQKVVASSIARYPGSETTFYALDQFCGGDFLKLTIGSLNSVCQKTNEVHSLQFLYKMLDRPVSTKKHSMRLIDTIAKKKSVLQTFEKLWETEKNPSMRNVIIMAIQNSFVADPDDVTWSTLKKMFLSLNKLDKDTLSTLLYNDNVKRMYKAEYINICWRVLKNLEDVKELNFSGEKSSVLNRITKYIDLLPTEFLDQLVMESFQSTNVEQVQISYTNLVVTYMLRGEPEQNKERVLSVMKVLKQYINETWCVVDPEHCFKFNARRRVFRLFNELVSFSITNRDNKNIRVNLSLCVEEILNIFNPTQFYKQYLQMQLTLIYLDAVKTQAFGNKLKNEFIDSNIQQFGPEILSFLIKAITEFVTLVQNTFEKFERMEVCEAIMTGNYSDYSEVCALHLLEKNDARKKMYDEVTTKMKKSSSKMAQIYLNDYFNEE